MKRLYITLLGGIQARVAGGPSIALPARKAQALLAFLALHAGQPQPRDKLAALLWGDSSHTRARHSLRQALVALRGALPKTPSILLEEVKTVALIPSLVEVDVREFEQLVTEGTVQALEQAAGLYRGDLLEGLGEQAAQFEDWLAGERERLRELCLEALAKLLSHYSGNGVMDRAIQTAIRILALDPLQEPAHRALMRLHARQGRRGAALRQYQACVTVLQRELGIGPEAETRALYQEILRGRSAGIPWGDTAMTRLHRRERARARATRGAGTEGSSPVLIGRRTELARLRQAVAEAARGHGRTVVIIGEGGVGKSRLVEELIVLGPGQEARILIGRCHEAEQILPFRPWTDALRAAEVTGDLELRDELAPVWRSELCRILPEWASGTSEDSTGPPDQVRLFDAVARLFERLVARESVVLILEDLHWADEMSLRLLDFVSRQAKRWPLLIVGTARIEELAEASPLRNLLSALDREQRLTRLDLTPLTEHETAALVRSLSPPGMDASRLKALAAHVWALSEGNPFVAVETVRMYREGESIEASRGLSLPDRVRQMITDRLERLEPAARQLVAVAAAIGREFDFALLQRASGMGEREAAAAIEELVARRLMQAVGERLDVAHERFREVAYGLLLPPRRKLVHRDIAVAIEELFRADPDPPDLALGRHYLAAETWEKALDYLWKAGKRAVARSAYREAVACFEQALSALDQLPRTREMLVQAIDLRFELRQSLTVLNDVRRILGCLREAETLARSIGDALRQGWASSFLTNCLDMIGDHESAVESGHRALAIAEATHAVPLRVWSNYYLGWTHYLRGEFRMAVECLTSARTPIEVPTARPGWVLPASIPSSGLLAASLAELGEFDAGRRYGTEAIGAAEALEDPYSLVYGCWGLGVVHLRRGDFERGVSVLRRGLAVCQSRELPLGSVLIAPALGYGFACAGRFEEALALLEGSDRRLHALPLLAETYLLAGRLEDAALVVRRACDRHASRKERGMLAWALRLAGEIAARQDPADAERAVAAYGQAVELASELGMRPLLAHCHLGLAVLHTKTGHHEQARSELVRAMQRFQSLGMATWIGRVGELADRLGLAHAHDVDVLAETRTRGPSP